MSESTEAPAGFPRRLGSYTTARVTRGRVERLERHAGRLARDAKRLGLPPPSRAEVECAALATAEADFDRQDGILRIEWSRRQGEPPELTCSTRALGDDPDRYRAITSKIVHPGIDSRANTKHVDVAAYDEARAEALRAGTDEVLLFDAQGFLVEGSRSNLIVVRDTGRLVTPALDLGPVEGLGLGIVLEAHAEIAQARIVREDLVQAREVLAVNAVRGVVAITELDGTPIGDGQPGPEARRLGAPFGQPRP